MVQTKRERERKNTKKIHMKEMKKVRLGMSNGTKTVDDYEDEDFYVRFWKIYWHIINHEWQCIEWQFTEFLKHIGAIFNEQHELIMKIREKKLIHINEKLPQLLYKVLS